MERRRQFKAELNDLAFSHMDEGCEYLDGAVAGAGSDELLEGLVVGGAAVGIAGAILLDGPDDDVGGAEDFGPADGGGEEVGVAEGDVGDGDGFAYWLGVGCVMGRNGDSDVGVGEGGSADLSEDVDAEGQELDAAEGMGDGAGALEFALLGALAVAEVEGVGVEVAGGEGGADGGVHAAGEADDGAGPGEFGGRGWQGFAHCFYRNAAHGGWADLGRSILIVPILDWRTAAACDFATLGIAGLAKGM